MVSVIIPVYNQASKIVKTLVSLEKQTDQDFEVIIINDGSTDNLEEVLGNFFKNSKSERTYEVLSQKNSGAPAARNAGFRASHGDLLLFCDADAALAPEALAEMKKALSENLEAAYAYSSFMWGKKLFKLGAFNADKLRSMPYIHTMSLLRREAFPASGWDESIRKLQDWDLWLTILEQGKAGCFIDKVLFSIQTGGHISNWLPAFAYKLLPFLPNVKKYKRAVAIVKTKHGLK